MTFSRSMGRNPLPRSLAHMRGYTLLELLIVVTILAAIAGIGVTLFTSIDTARAPIAQYTMREVANAIMRFHQDTGFWPRTGRYLPNSSKPTIGSDSPADFTQLFGPASQLFCPESMPVCPGQLDASLNWNPDTQHGWHGPYLGGFNAPLVNVTLTYPAAATGEPGAPSGIPQPVPGIADGFRSLPRDDTNTFNPNGPFLAWVNPLDTTKIVVGHGNPLLFFPPGAATTQAGLTKLEDEGCNTTTTTDQATGVTVTVNAPCLISFGPDGIYGTNDDEVFNF